MAGEQQAHLGDMLFYSKRPLFADEMEQRLPRGTEEIILTGLCHPTAGLHVAAVTVGSVPALAMVCAACAAPVLTLATTDLPRIVLCLCAREFMELYELPAKVLVRCAGCSWRADFAVRRGAPPSDGPPASLPVGPGRPAGSA